MKGFSRAGETREIRRLVLDPSGSFYLFSYFVKSLRYYEAIFGENILIRPSYIYTSETIYLSSLTHRANYVC